MRQTDLMPLNHCFFCTASLEHVEFRLPKNQWLIHRRICSLPDGCNLLTISYHFLRPSANETNRLLINHWFFGRRFLIDILMSHRGAMPRLNILMSHRVGRIWCLKTIGFKKRFPGETEKHYINHWFFRRRSLTCQLWDTRGRLKTIGLKTNTSCETRREALKPLVFDACPARGTYGSTALKPLVWMHAEYMANGMHCKCNANAWQMHHILKTNGFKASRRV